jgi:2',3'-cyclic-nucleotide 2'-phosphodiesterase (5'-nucleotidase family)
MLELTTPSKKVSFLFTSDEHGYITRQAKLQQEVTRTREENPDGTLLISCGDVFEGSAENGVLGLEASRSMLDVAGYDLATLGNHDFDRGAQVTREWVEKLPCDVLVSNLKDAATGELLRHTVPSKVYELNGVKVGLIGATTQETATILPKAKLQGLEIEDPFVSVKAEVDRLKAQGVEVIGLVSHLGLPTDRKMADEVPELDFILGGHTHDALKTPEQHGQTVIVHPGCFRQAIGHLDLAVDPASGQVTGVDYKLVAGEGMPADEGAVGRLCQTFKADVESHMGQKVASLPRRFDYDPNLLGEGMEALLGSAVRQTTGADLMLVNQKGLRAALPQGEISVGDVYNVFPFDNHLVTTQMSVPAAIALLDESFRRQDQTSFAVGSSAYTYAVDRNTHQSMLVVNLEAGAELPQGVEPLTDSDVYRDCATQAGVVPASARVRVATVDFLLQGGLGYFEAGKTPIEHEYGTIRDVLQSHLQRTYPLAQTV